MTERLVLIVLVIGTTGALFGVLLVSTAVVASDTLDFPAGDLLDVGPLPEAEAVQALRDAGFPRADGGGVNDGDDGAEDPIQPQSQGSPTDAEGGIAR